MKIKHIVFLRLKGDNADKMPIAQKIKADLDALAGKIPGLSSISVGIDMGKTEQSADLALVTEFLNQEALKAYVVHPLHVACVEFIRANTQQRQVVDFEI